MGSFDENVFMVAATFAGNEDSSVEVKIIPFAEDIRADIGDQLAQQFQSFSELEEVDYNGRYKADEDECLCIRGYKDPRKTLGGFLSLCYGGKRELVTSVEDLHNCRALLFHVPECPGKILIQRFSRSLVAQKGRYFGVVDRRRFGRLDESAFCFGTSLAGYYSIADDKFYFRNVQTIRSAIPGFDEMYAPGADEEMIKSFFEGNAKFEPSSAKAIAARDSKKIARLVWLINDAKVNVSSRLADLKRFDQLLNMKCFNEGMVRFPAEVNRAVIILRILLGDVFEQDGKVYLSNSRKALSRFED